MICNCGNGSTSGCKSLLSALMVLVTAASSFFLFVAAAATTPTSSRAIGRTRLMSSRSSPSLSERTAAGSFSARTEINVLGIELVTCVGMPVEGNAVLDAEGFQFLELPVASLGVRKEKMPVLVQGLAQVVSGLGIELRAVVAADLGARGIEFAQELFQQVGGNLAADRDFAGKIVSHFPALSVRQPRRNSRSRASRTLGRARPPRPAQVDVVVRFEDALGRQAAVLRGAGLLGHVPVDVEEPHSHDFPLYGLTVRHPLRAFDSGDTAPVWLAVNQPNVNDLPSFPGVQVAPEDLPGGAVSGANIYCLSPNPPKLVLLATTLNFWWVFLARAARRSLSAFAAFLAFRSFSRSIASTAFASVAAHDFSSRSNVGPAEVRVADGNMLVDAADELALLLRRGEPDFPKAVNIVVGDVPEDVGKTTVEVGLKELAVEPPQDEPDEGGAETRLLLGG